MRKQGQPLIGFTLIIVLTVLLLVGCQSTQEPSIFLTQEEADWLEAHKGQIAIGYTTDYPPVEYLESGTYVGISADYFKLLESKLGIPIEMVQYDQWSDLIESARAHRVTGITAATLTDERSTYLNFTVPYIINPNVIITRKNFSEQLTFDKLSNMSLRLLVIEDYAVIDYLKEHHPQIQYTTVPNTDIGMQMVSFGEADAMIVEVMSAAASIQQNGITNLIVNTETPYDSSLSIATRKDWPLLNSILNKGLAQITPAERNHILSKYIPLDRAAFYEKPWFRTLLFTSLALLLLLIGAIVLWNRTLTKMVAEKTRLLRIQNQQLGETQKQLEAEVEIRKASEAHIKHKSYHDELTGLYNRACYNEQVKLLERDALIPLSIILADLNGLKITNDTFGHQEGDNLLIAVAQILKSACRATDIVARIGGDEFVILLPHTTKEVASRICEKIKIACSQAQSEPLKPSVALGYATRDSLDLSIDGVFKQAEDLMYQNKMYESESTHTGILESFNVLLRETTYETYDHSRRLADMALAIGRAMALDEAQLNALSTLSDLHDLGKVAIPEAILQKPGPLTPDEWQKVKRHPELGYKIANANPKLKNIAEGILCHHERWDGTGYPRGLSGDQIPLIARIISLVDTYDVMTHERAYQAIKTHQEALEELKVCSGTQFDPQIVRIFLSLNLPDTSAGES